MDDYTSSEETLVAGGLIGYRAWDFSASGCNLDAAWSYGWHLNSVARNYTWRPGRNEAQCIGGRGVMVVAGWWNKGPYGNFNVELTSEDHSKSFPAPMVECTCGFYARYADENHGYSHRGLNGVIEASGKTILGRTGFRSQYAEVKALYYNPSSFFLDEDSARLALKGLGDTYHVPVFDSFEEAKRRFPPSDVSELLLNPKQMPPQASADLINVWKDPTVRILKQEPPTGANPWFTWCIDPTQNP